MAIKGQFARQNGVVIKEEKRRIAYRYASNTKGESESLFPLTEVSE